MEGVNLYMSLAEEVRISHEVRGSKDVVIPGGQRCRCDFRDEYGCAAGHLDMMLGDQSS